MRAVILAAGKGTRLAPLTDVLPKPLLPVGGVPMLAILARQLAHYGFTHITVTSHHLSHMVAAFFPWLQAQVPGVTLAHLPFGNLLGTIGGVSLVPHLADDGPFLVVNGDHLSTLNWAALMAHHRTHNPAVTLAVTQQPYPIRLGVLEVAADGALTAIHEKPTHHFTVWTGAAVYASAVLRYIPQDGWLDAPTLFTDLVAAGDTVQTYAFPGPWLDIGTPPDFAAANTLFAERRADFLPDERA